MNVTTTEVFLLQNTTDQLFDPHQAAKEEYLYHCINDPFPQARNIIESFDATAIALHICFIIMVTITLALFIEEVFYFQKHIKLSYRRRLSILQAGIPPVFAVTSLVGTFFPAGHVMIDFVCSVYFGIGLHALLVLMVNYFGGIRQLLLRFNGSRFKISTGPLCCLFLCLPTFKMTKKSFYVLWYATFQAAFTRPVVLFFQGVIKPDSTVPIPAILYTVLLVASMLTGMWALVVFRTASQPYIGQYNVTGKFFAFQMVLLIANLQPFIITFCYIPCVLPYTFYARKLVVNYQITVVEFFLLSMVTRCLYRRSSDNAQLPVVVAKEEKNLEVQEAINGFEAADTSTFIDNDTNREDHVV